MPKIRPRSGGEFAIEDLGQEEPSHECDQGSILA